MPKKSKNKTTIPGISQVEDAAGLDSSGKDSGLIDQAVKLPGKVVEESVKIVTTVATAPGKIMGAMAAAPYIGIGEQAVGVFNKLDSEKTGQIMGAMGKQLGDTPLGQVPRPRPTNALDEEEDNIKRFCP